MVIYLKFFFFPSFLALFHSWFSMFRTVHELCVGSKLVYRILRQIYFSVEQKIEKSVSLNLSSDHPHWA